MNPIDRYPQGALRASLATPPTPSIAIIAMVYSAVLVMLALHLSACGSEFSELTHSQNQLREQEPQQHNTIINAELETEHPAAGALLGIGGGNYYGSFCSATLIAPSWVLTAAHCINSQFVQAGIPVYFGVGTDMRTWEGDGPIDGELYVVDTGYIHPGWSDSELNDLSGVFHDIGLLHLQTPVTNVTPIAIAEEGWTPQYSEYLALGFGVSAKRTSAQDRGAPGQKRSAMLPFVGLESNFIVTDGNTHLDGSPSLCSGDSGGTLLEPDGSRIIGVHSTAGGGGTEDSEVCFGFSRQIRVDLYADWIEATINGLEDTGCEPNECACEAACQTGVCIDTICELNIENCSDALNCRIQCGAAIGCQTDCIGAANEEDYALSDSVLICAQTNGCSTLQCPECASLINSCLNETPEPPIECPQNQVACDESCVSCPAVAGATEFGCTENLCVATECVPGRELTPTGLACIIPQATPPSSSSSLDADTTNEDAGGFLGCASSANSGSIFWLFSSLFIIRRCALHFRPFWVNWTK